MRVRAAATSRIPATASAVAVLTVALPALAGDKLLGEYLSAECVTCHQLSGQYSGIPPIVGWRDDTFIQILNEYRHKKRDNPVMQAIAARLTDEEVAALASYFGGLSARVDGK